MSRSPNLYTHGNSVTQGYKFRKPNYTTMIIFKEDLLITIQNYVNSKRKLLDTLNEYKNPYYWWWKVRKYWKRPKIHLAYVGKVTWWYGLYINKDFYNKYLDVTLSGLGWKDKEGDPRFEWDPYLAFTFLRRWQIIFIWNFCTHFMSKDKIKSISISEQTWETILSMANYDKNIADACHNSGFIEIHEFCPEKEYIYPPKQANVFRNLTQYGLEQYYSIPRSKQLKTNYYD